MCAVFLISRVLCGRRRHIRQWRYMSKSVHSIMYCVNRSHKFVLGFFLPNARAIAIVNQIPLFVRSISAYCSTIHLAASSLLLQLIPYSLEVMGRMH